MNKVFDKLREMSGGKLTQKQVDSTNKLLHLDLNAVIGMLGVAGSTPKKTGVKGLALIKSFEGKRLVSYDDGVGVWTVGYGTTRINGVKVQKGSTITDSQAELYLKADLETFENVVNNVVTIEVNQNQFDALVSLTYNIGATAFTNSTLLRKLNSGDFKDASEQFLVWNKGGGKVMTGLVRRREAEKELFNSK